MDFPDHWIHVRPSNTEPIIRIIAEARTAAKARAALKRLKGEIAALGGELMTMILKNIDLCTPYKRIHDAEIRVENGRIAFAGPKRPRTSGRRAPETEIIDGRGATAVPGLIDIHIHGGGGADFMDGTAEAARTVLRTHLRAGTTSVLATLMTAPPDRIREAVRAVNDVSAEGMVLGLHLEGPHIAASKRGAQPAESVRPFDVREIAAIARLSKVPIRIVTLAPELPGAAAYIRALVRRGIIPAAGHSDATFEQAIRGFEAGIRHGTHLFNAMTGIHHREPGLAGALLLNEEASVEVIADGVHLHPATVFLVLTAKPADMVVLVTDATRPAGSSTARPPHPRRPALRQHAHPSRRRPERRPLERLAARIRSSARDGESRPASRHRRPQGIPEERRGRRHRPARQAPERQGRLRPRRANAIRRLSMSLQESFNRSGFSKFLNRPAGRVFRLAAGLAFLGVGFVYRAPYARA